MAKIKDKKNKFNFVDLILLIIILAVIAALVYLVVLAYNTHFLKGNADTEIEYVLRIENVDNDIRYTVEEGDSVIELDSYTEIGTVVEYYEEPSEYIGYDSEGNAVVSEDPVNRDIVLVIRAEATGDDSRYDIDSYSLTVGKEIDFRIPGFTGRGQCVSLEVSGDE